MFQPHPERQWGNLCKCAHAGGKLVLPSAGWVLLLYPDRNPEPQRDALPGLAVQDLGTGLADPEAFGSRLFRRQNRIALDTPDGGSLPWALIYQQPKQLAAPVILSFRELQRS